MTFTIYKESRLGARHDNEDRVGFGETVNCRLLVACDGMGGLPRGEVAAQFVLEHLLHTFHMCARPRLRAPAAFLRDSILAAHEALRTYCAEHQIAPVPCTTGVVALVQDGYVWFAHVGDSRAYLIREGDVVSRTVDHSYVQFLINEGKLSTAQAEAHPERHKITNCIGQAKPPYREISEPTELYPGDILLVCTDGLWGNVSDKNIARILSHADIPTGLGCLMDLAEAVAGRSCDNVSAVALRFLGDDEAVFASPATSLIQVTDSDVEIALTMIEIASLPAEDQK